MIFIKKLGANIRSLRKEAGITQETLATKMQINGCDITRSAYAKIEVGQRHIYPDELYLIKAILNIDWNDLFVPMND